MIPSELYFKSYKTSFVFHVWKVSEVKHNLKHVTVILICVVLRVTSNAQQRKETERKGQQSISCHQTRGSQRSLKETKKERQNWFCSWALLTLTRSFEVDRLIVLFRMTTKKWNVYGDHHRINGRHHMFVCAHECMCVCVVVHVHVFDPGQRRSSHSFGGTSRAVTLSVSSHDFGCVKMERGVALLASGLLDTGTKEGGGMSVTFL